MKRHTESVQHSSKFPDWRTPPRHHWFWSQVVVQPSGCWHWRAVRRVYGTTKYNGKLMGAHRIAFHLAFGFWPPMVCHRCDNPPCVRPDHLFAGTARTNLLDALAKGRKQVPLGNGGNAAFFGDPRRYRGEGNGNSRLTWRRVQRLRRIAHKYSISALSREFGVARATIRAVLAQETWK
jgi:hypothetical protein